MLSGIMPNFLIGFVHILQIHVGGGFNLQILPWLCLLFNLHYYVFHCKYNQVFF